MEAIKYNLAGNLIENALDHVVEKAIVSVTDSLDRIEFAIDNFCKI